MTLAMPIARDCAATPRGADAPVDLQASLRCLQMPNLRLFVGGQGVSQVGTWMQAMALQWLVWRLTHSAVALVLVAFLGQFPVALFGLLGGVVADRYPRRRVLLVTQTVAMGQAGVLAVLALAGVLETKQVHLVYVLSSVLGIVSAFDLPARQALLAQLAGPEVESAVALNSSVFNGARLLGPAVAGLLVPWAGEGVCFLLNALSYGAMLFCLWRMELPRSRPALPSVGTLVEGVRFAARSTRVRAPLILLAVSSFFGWSCLAIAPVFASRLGGQASLLGALLAAVGLGSLLGATALLVAPRGVESLERRLAWGATILSVGLALLAASQNGWSASLAMLLIGFGFTQHLGATNSLLHVLSPPALRGRVMGIFLTAFIGISPLGGLAVGWLAVRLDAGLVVAAAALVVITASALFRGGRSSQGPVIVSDNGLLGHHGLRGALLLTGAAGGNPSGWTTPGYDGPRAA